MITAFYISIFLILICILLMFIFMMCEKYMLMNISMICAVIFGACMSIIGGILMCLN